MFCIFAIPLFGKRRLFLVALVGVIGFCFAIAANAYATFDLGTSSFHYRPDPHAVRPANDNYVGLVLFFGLAACANVVNCMPWLLSSEVFPFRIRGTASGFSSAFSYICIFAATKTYFDVEHSMSIVGAFVFYGLVSVFGYVRYGRYVCVDILTGDFASGSFLILFQIMPETEKRSLEEIEQYFSDDTRRWNDRRIHSMHGSNAGKDNAGFDHVELREESCKPNW